MALHLWTTEYQSFQPVDLSNQLKKDTTFQFPEQRSFSATARSNTQKLLQKSIIDISNEVAYSPERSNSTCQNLTGNLGSKKQYNADTQQTFLQPASQVSDKILPPAHSFGTHWLSLLCLSHIICSASPRFFKNENNKSICKTRFSKPQYVPL